MVSIRLAINGLPQLVTYFDDMRQKTLDLRRPLDKGREVFEEIVSERFRDEGPGWAPQQPQTDIVRAFHGISGPILHESGALEESYKRGGADHVEIWSPVSVEVGSSARYAAPTEFGFSNRGTIPATDDTPAITMHGQAVPSRSVIMLGFDEYDSRIGDAVELTFFQDIGL